MFCSLTLGDWFLIWMLRRERYVRLALDEAFDTAEKPSLITMNLDVALTLCALVLVGALAGLALNVAMVVRRRYYPVESAPALDPRARLVSIATDWPKVAAAVVLISTMAPWISGSAVGVQLPQTLWGLPWVRWPIGIAAVLVVVLVWVAPYQRSAPASIATAAAFMVCVVFGTAMFLVTVLAESASRYTFQADMYLRSFGMDSDVLPVVREGLGAPLFTLAAVAGIYLTAVRYRRRNAMAPERSVFADAEPMAEGGDDWWK